MKFNIDGAASGDTSKKSIGRLLRDNNGRIKAMFFKSIGIGYSRLAEVFAFREAFIIFAASERNNSFKLMIESDSTNIVP